MSCKTAPTAVCPSCGHVLQFDDPGDISEGDERECYKCEATLVCAWAEVVKIWDWKTKE